LNTKLKIAAVIVAIIILVSSVAGYIYIQDDEDEDDLFVHFFNIGHGLSILIQTPDGKNILIDAGSFDNFTTTVDFLDELNVDRLDAFIVTHPHPDHISFASEVLASYEVLSVYHPGMADDLDPSGYEEFIEAVENEGCPVFTNDQIEPGDYLSLSEDVSFQVMWVDKNATKINDGCFVIKAVYEETSILFAADAGYYAEGQMINSTLDLDVDLLQVGHHGVNDSTSAAFLEEVTPEVAIISAGFGYGTPPVPQTGVVSRLSGVPIYLTMFKHMITVSSNGQDYGISVVV
jgi:beta-lactamase superfamily II metal-dependent hydrolase